MQSRIRNQKKSSVIQTLIRYWQIVLSGFVLLLVSVYFVSSTASQHASTMLGVEPTATPIPAIVARIDNYLVSETYHISGVWAGHDVPELIVETAGLSLGMLVDGQGIQRTIDLLYHLGEDDVAVERATIYNEEYIELALDDGLTIVYAGRNDPKETALVLQEMYTIFSIEGTVPKQIDLRFGKPSIK